MRRPICSARLEFFFKNRRTTCKVHCRLGRHLQRIIQSATHGGSILNRCGQQGVDSHCKRVATQQSKACERLRETFGPIPNKTLTISRSREYNNIGNSPVTMAERTTSSPSEHENPI